MTAAVPIVLRRDALKREVVYFGDNALGFVMPYDGGRKVGAIWRCTLPDLMAVPRPASDLAHGRRLLINMIAEWFSRAPAGRAIADDIRSNIYTITERVSV